MGQIRSPTPSSSSTAPSSRCWSSMMTFSLQVIFSPNLFFLVLVVVWGCRSRKGKMWLSGNFRSKWLPLKCVLKAIDRGQEAIEWTGFFGSRSIRDPFSRCEIHFVNSVLQLSPFSQQLALYSKSTPLLADSQCIHSLILSWTSLAKDCQLCHCHSHILFFFSSISDELLKTWKDCSNQIQSLPELKKSGLNAGESYSDNLFWHIAVSRDCSFWIIYLTIT